MDYDYNLGLREAAKKHIFLNHPPKQEYVVAICKRNVASKHAWHARDSRDRMQQPPPPRACTIAIKNKTTKKSGQPKQFA